VGGHYRAAHQLTFNAKAINVKGSLRVLIPDKKGVGKRISQAIRLAGGEVEHLRVRREMRGMTETEIVVSFSHACLWSAIIQSLGQVPGVALLNSDEPRVLKGEGK